MDGLRTPSDSDWVVTNIRLRRGLLERLTEEADQRVLGRNLLINMMLERALDDLNPIDSIFKPREEGHNEEDYRNAVDQPGSGIWRDGLLAGSDPSPSSADPADHSAGLC